VTGPQDVVIREYQEQLRRLASELSIAEERERRTIATDLHDHIGQALAVMRMKLVQLQGNAVFSGLDGSIAEILSLLEKTIAYTRTLTFEISPPILYQLGVRAALEWLAEQMKTKHGITIRLKAASDPILTDENKALLFSCVRELLMNVVKHAGVREASIQISGGEGHAKIVVEDHGTGFDLSAKEECSCRDCGFGLFSIRERLRVMGGDVLIETVPGRGTKVSLSIGTGADNAGAAVTG
jgi:signal transduction histidine kinase